MMSACATQATFQTAKRPSPEFCVRPRCPSPVASGHVMRTAAASAAAARIVAWRMRTPCRMSSILHDPSSFARSRAARLPAAALLAAVAAWLSQSTLAVGGLDGARIGLLPLSPFAIAAALLAGAAVVGLARAGASLAPVWLLTVIVLPWLPLPVPTVFLIWAGSIRWLIWTAVALIMFATMTPPSACGASASPRAVARVGPAAAGGGCVRVCHLYLCRVAGVAVGSRRRRAALPRHHAKPAARWRSEDREQPPAWRLSGVLRRRVGAALHPSRHQRRDLLDPRARAVGGRCAGVCRRRIPWCRPPAARHRVVWQCPGVASGVAGVGTGGGGLVRLGRGHARGDDHLSQLHRVSRRSRQRDRAHRRMGVHAGGRGAANRRDPPAAVAPPRRLRSRSCRGCTVDSRCSRAASARWCCCACRRRRTRRGRRWRFSRCRRSARSCG